MVNSRPAAERIIWYKMKDRCTNTRLREYKNYGGRGIVVCESWRNSFQAFIADVGPRPSPLHTLDRIDNDGDYEPRNVRWATRQEQVRNRRGVHLLTHNGETLTASEWGRRLNWSSQTILNRVAAGWTTERILTTPPHKKTVGKTNRVGEHRKRPVDLTGIRPIINCGRGNGHNCFIDLTGHRYGLLLVRKLLGRKGTHTYWECACDCGGETVASTNKLRMGDTTSCGCLSSKNTIGDRFRTHGMSRSSEWVIWHSMNQRCHRPRNSGYKTYGARGIKVCRRWRKSFQAFFNDMGPRPSKRHSLDRIDNSKDYGPKNCRWATKREQASNTRKASLLTFNGETKTMNEWSRVTGIKVSTIHCRLRYLGWPVADALGIPASNGSRRRIQDD